MKCSYLICLLALVPLFLWGNGGLAFEAEELAIILVRDPADSTALLWTVQGDYYFSNLTDSQINSPIAFPIPSADDVGIARLLELTIIDPEPGMQVKLANQHAQGLVFTLELPARGFARVRLAYSQLLAGKEAVYILKSANSWGRPLPYSGLDLTVEHGLCVDIPGFPNPLRFDSEAGTRYRWEFYDSIFEHDFQVIVR